MHHPAGLIIQSWARELVEWAPIGPHYWESAALDPQMHVWQCTHRSPVQGGAAADSRNSGWTHECHQWNSISLRTAQRLQKEIDMCVCVCVCARATVCGCSKAHCQSLMPCKGCCEQGRVWRLYNSAPWNQFPGARFTCLPLDSIWASPGLNEKHASILCMKEYRLGPWLWWVVAHCEVHACPRECQAVNTIHLWGALNGLLLP